MVPFERTLGLSDIDNFASRRNEIEKALNGSTGIINKVTEDTKEDIFYMLLFCLCVPQSKALKAQTAVSMLRHMDYYRKDISLDKIKQILKPNVRFYATKSLRLVEAKASFEKLWIELSGTYHAFVCCLNLAEEFSVLKGLRSMLTREVNGFGFKAASHFARNIGMRGLCILDTHIYDGLVKRGLLDKKPKSVTIGRYCEIEEIMMKYARDIGLSVDELDLLWWSDKTGYVFK